MQDTTSSAMTEVALGLSMAFFTLLIVALLSMSVPNESTNKQSVKAVNNIPEEQKINKAINIQLGDKASGKNTMQFAFYYDKKFYDKSLTIRSIDSFIKEKALVVAVNPQLAFSDVFALRQKINHPKLSITTSNKAWHTRLQQLATLE